MEYNLKTDLFFLDAKETENIASSVIPGNKIIENRSETTVNVNKNIMHINIDAEDKTALRAAFNSLLKLIKLSENIVRREYFGSK